MKSKDLCPKDKIYEIFHYFNIDGEIDSVFGNWAVSENGDVVNYLYSYAIFSIHLNDNDWIEKLTKKVWFKSKCVEDLTKALDRAKTVINNN